MAMMQIEERLPGFVQTLMSSGIDLHALAHKLHKPLRTLWLNQDSQLWHLPDELDFFPLVCASVSSTEMPFPEYVQGAGDDHESWAMGLSAELFWRHRDEIMASPRIASETVQRIVAHNRARHASLMTDAQSDSSLTMTTFELGNTNVSIVTAPNRLKPSCLEQLLDQYAAVLDVSGHDVATPDLRSSFLHLRVQDAKRDRYSLQKVLDRAVAFVHEHLSQQRRVAVFSSPEPHAATCVALGLMVRWFEPDGALVSSCSDVAHVAHSSLELLAGWRVSGTLRSLARDSKAVTKDVIQQFESFVISRATFTPPPRLMIKMVTRHFMTAPEMQPRVLREWWQAQQSQAITK